MNIIFIYIANDQIETKSHLRLTLKIKKRWTIHSRFEERSLSDSESVFGKKKEYQLKFNHEDDGRWYIDFPGTILPTST